MWRFSGRMWQKTLQVKKKIRVRERHILPRNVTNVTRHIFCHRKKWQMWRHSPTSETGSWEEIWLRPTLSHSRIGTFLPVQKSFVLAGPKSDDFREGCDKKRHQLKNLFSWARVILQRCDKCDASHFLSPGKIRLKHATHTRSAYNFLSFFLSFLGFEDPT